MRLSPLVNEAIRSLEEVLRDRIKQGNGFYQVTPGSELIATLMTVVGVVLKKDHIRLDVADDGKNLIFTFYTIPKTIEGLALPDSTEESIKEEIENDIIQEFGSLEKADDHANQVIKQLFGKDKAGPTPDIDPAPDADPDKPFYSEDELKKIIKDRFNN